MTMNNIQDDGAGHKIVLGLIGLRLPALGGWLHNDDIDSPTGKGAIFRIIGTESSPHRIFAYIMVVDVTDDSTEPDISKVKPVDVLTLNASIRDGTESEMKARDMQMVKWQGAHLLDPDPFRAHLCAYVMREKEEERQVITLRLRVKDRNVVVLACYDLSQRDVCALQICRTLQRADIYSERGRVVFDPFGRKLQVPDLYAGGNGETQQTAVIVNTNKSSVGVAAEYLYIESVLGEKNVDWSMKEQELSQTADGKAYDIVTVHTRAGEIRCFHFDISSFFGVTSS